MRINFDFSDLDAFLAVFDTGSLQAASKRLSISQSTVTRRLQKLEAALGVTLFDRTTRKLNPSAQARALRPRAERILLEAGDVCHEFDDASLQFAHQRQYLVTIATVPTLAGSVLVRAIRQFEASGDSARINVLDSFGGDAIEAVENGEADFGLGFVGIHEPGLDIELLGEDPFMLAVPRTHELAGRQSIGWRDVVDAPLVVPAKGVGNRMLIDHAMAAERLELNWKYQVRRSSTALDLVAAGLGVGILPASAIADYAAGAIIGIELREPAVSRRIGIFRKRGKTLSAAAQALYRILLGSSSASKASQ